MQFQNIMRRYISNKLMKIFNQVHKMFVKLNIKTNFAWINIENLNIIYWKNKTASNLITHFTRNLLLTDNIF